MSGYKTNSISEAGFVSVFMSDILKTRSLWQAHRLMYLSLLHPKMEAEPATETMYRVRQKKP